MSKCRYLACRNESDVLLAGIDFCDQHQAELLGRLADQPGWGTKQAKLTLRSLVRSVIPACAHREISEP